MAGQPLHYFQMWSLVQSNYNGGLCDDAAFMRIISPELLMAIFWEETQFANIRQIKFNHSDWLMAWTVPPPATPEERRKMLPGNHAIGFGQVERDTLLRIKTLGPDKLDDLIPGTPGNGLDLKAVDEKVLTDDGKGVQLTWRALWYLYGTGIKSKAGLAKVYGGNPNLANVPPAWINSEAVQKAYQLLGPINFIDTDWRQNMRLLAGAFWIARQNGDFPRAFGVSQEEAAAVGAPLRDIVTSNGKGLNPNLIADLRQFVTDQVGATPGAKTPGEW
jgi:hypothetical protein